MKTFLNIISSYEKIIPLILIVLDFLAAIVYLSKYDLKRSIYWVAAGVLTICVTI